MSTEEGGRHDGTMLWVCAAAFHQNRPTSLSHHCLCVSALGCGLECVSGCLNEGFVPQSVAFYLARFLMIFQWWFVHLWVWGLIQQFHPSLFFCVRSAPWNASSAWNSFKLCLFVVTAKRFAFYCFPFTRSLVSDHLWMEVGLETLREEISQRRFDSPLFTAKKF